MSRLGRTPIPIPVGVQVRIENRTLEARGPLGTLAVRLHPDVDAYVEDTQVTVRPSLGREQKRGVSAQWGTVWSLIRNALQGVSQGFTRRLELHGVGYRAEASKDTLRLALGFSHPVVIKAPPGIAFSVEKNTVTVSGFDKAVVGEVAAAIRRARPPEPYKGKGVRYQGEVIRRKPGKSATGSASS